MTLIQFILIVAMGGLGVLSLFALRSRRLSRLVVLALLSAGVFSVLRPGITSGIAHLLGVGRGADLMLYVFLITTGYALMQLYSRMRTLDRQVTLLARALAIGTARKTNP
jgi:small membrane protein